jgi:hypothetical protein|tara:strand:- start:94 stop:264 length:171 start_codon:yes stop_codon:yes gene_type:complete
MQVVHCHLENVWARSGGRGRAFKWANSTAADQQNIRENFEALAAAGQTFNDQEEWH